MPDLTGEKIGDYQVLRRLGRGAMAEVYLAEQSSLARQVALKVLSNELADDATYVERFQHEARAAAALVHANIVQIYEVGRSAGYHFIAQEYVPGRNLGELIERQGRIEPGLTLDVIRQVVGALHKAAECGIVHRDIKPENIMLARSGEVKVADFGLARVNEAQENKLTQVGVTMGTPLYMSPEQIEGRPVDTRSDMYSLGVTAYHMLSGEAPFRGDTPLSVAVQHLNSEPPPLVDACPDLSLHLVRIVTGLMAKKPDDRPESPAVLLGELRTLAKSAAEEGWAEGPENWSLAGMRTVEADDSGATAELGRLMRQATGITAASSRWGRIALLLAACAVGGGVLASATRPDPLLASQEGPLEKSDVLRQIFHAKMVDTEAAWKAVAQQFPDALPYYHYLADQNLATLYLRRERYTDALRICRRLSEIENQQDFQLFGLAGVVVCQTADGNREAAESALSMFPMNELVTLEQRSPQMAAMFREAKGRLNGSAG
ncbi:MAG: serine/threonine-protein kinase [Planctomycetota bacterium]